MSAEHGNLAEGVSFSVSEKDAFKRHERPVEQVITDYDASGRALWNDNVVRGPNQGVPLLKRERPDHRLMVMLRAQGKTSAEVAEFMGVTTATVNLVLRQPWARAMLMDLIHEKGEPGVISFLQGEVMPSLMRVVEVRDDPLSKRSEILAASKEILDRFMGKPTQRVETMKVPEPKDVETMQRELDQLRAEEARLRGN